MRKFIFFVISLLAIATAWSQQPAPTVRTISGTVTDTTKYPLADATVNLKSSTENLNTTTNASGKYHFSNVTSPEFVITITSVGFNDYVQSYKIAESSGKAFAIDAVRMRYKTNTLTEVVIMANPITIKEDTIEYRADAYKVREGAPVEDVLKKLPGVTVDKDGVVTAQGKEVKRVRVNGKDYFGGDVQTATQNLPADIIQNIQIIDDYGDRANQTGIKEGEPEKVLNINIQKGKNRGSFGNGTVAAGTKERYLGTVSANNFKEDRQLSLLASINNTNANTFNFNGGGRGGGARGANFGSNERGGFGGDGNTLSSSVGINYRDNWGKKITSYGSYSFASRTNTTVSNSYSQDINPNNISTTSRMSNSHSSSYNHRLTENIEYKIDSLDYLKVTPYVSYAGAKNYNDGTSIYNKPRFYTLSNGKSSNISSTPAWGSDLFYLHRFKKRGRNFNISGTINYSERDQDREVANSYFNIDSLRSITNGTQTNQNQFINNNNVNTTTNVRFTYDEPLGKSTFLELSYTYNNSSTKSLRDVNDLDTLTGLKIKNIKQSNDYKYDFVTNRYGISFHQTKTKYNFLLGLVAQPSDLTGMDYGRTIKTNQTDFNFAPTARFAYNFSRANSLTATYGGSSREPSFSQLQPVKDSSNIKNIIVGNPDLRAEFTNNFSLTYNKVGILTGSSIFSNLSFSETQNKIVSSRINDSLGTGRTTSYLNTNGFYNLSGNASFTQPFAKRKFSATINTFASYDNNISFTDNRKNTGNNWIIRPGARFRIDLPDIIDVDLNGGYTYNKNITRYADTTSTTVVRTYTFGIDGKNYFLKNWTLGYNFSKTINKGFVSSVNTNPAILNLFLERRFLKNNKGTLRLQGYDLFNQSSGLTRTVNGTTITDVQNNKLGRYFLLSFNLRLQKFVGKKFQRMPGEKRQGGDGTRGPRNGGGFGGGRNGGGGGGGRNN